VIVATVFRHLWHEHCLGICAFAGTTDVDQITKSSLLDVTNNPPLLIFPEARLSFRPSPHFFFIPIGKSTSLLQKMSVDSCVVHPDADIGCHPRCSNSTMTLCVLVLPQVKFQSYSLKLYCGDRDCMVSMHGEDLGIQIPTVGGNDSGPRSKDSNQKMFHGHLLSSTTMFRARPSWGFTEIFTDLRILLVICHLRVRNAKTSLGTRRCAGRLHLP
jgi:hypothetical protein